MASPRPPALLVAAAFVMILGACGGGGPELTTAPTVAPEALTSTTSPFDDEAARTITVTDVADLTLQTPLTPDDVRFGRLCTATDTGGDDGPRRASTRPLVESFESPTQWYRVQEDSMFTVGPRRELDGGSSFALVDVGLDLREIGEELNDRPDDLVADVGMAAAIEAALKLGEAVYITADTDDVVEFGFSVGVDSTFDVFRSCLTYEQDMASLTDFLESLAPTPGLGVDDQLLSIAGVCDCPGPTTDDLWTYLADSSDS